MSRKLLLTAAAMLLAIVSAVPSGAAHGVSVSSASRSGSTATVSGTATFEEASGPFAIGGSVTGFANGDVATALGINLVKGEVDVREDGIEFIWHLTDLGDVPPEGVRYTWSFQAGNQTFQLQAKSSNLVSITTTEDPIGHAQQASTGSWFQLRGACQAQYRGLPTAGCYHLTFLDGEFDTAANTVSMFMPFNTTDSIGRVVAQSFQRGAEITEVQTAGASLTAAGQAVVSTTATGSFLNGWGSFFAGKTVQGFVGTPTQTNPSFGQSWQTLTLNPDGSFSGTLTGASTANNTVHLRACNLRTCATTSAPL